MKKRFCMLLSVVLTSCGISDLFPDENGELRISFAREQESLTRAGLSIPDTSDFILTVMDSKGGIVYEGLYGASPESLSLKPDSYVIKAVSEEFVKPAFSSPQFGDEQCVVVPAGGVVNVKLVCSQINSGIRLHVDSGFLTAYPEGVLMLKSALGRIIYGYSEKRIAYFAPGNVSLVLNEGSKDQILMTREMKAREILDLKVSVSGATGSLYDDISRISMSVDTARVWQTDKYVIGEEGAKGSGTYDALTVYEALDSVGEEDVWVCGYIVGGDLSSSSASFEPPFSTRTNLLIGPRSSTSSRNSCMSVQLPSGELREELNLVDNPYLLGRKICLKGDIVESYYGLTGLKNVSEYELQ